MLNNKVDRLEVQKMRPDAIFFLLHCGAKPQNYGLVLACFSLSCNPDAIGLSRVAFHMESEKQAVPSPLLKLPAIDPFTESNFLSLIIPI